MVFDLTEPTIDEQLFERQDWTNSVYATDDTDLKEALPSNMTESRGIGLTMRAYVDTDHAVDSVTRRLRTGFLIYLNSALIYWHSKKQTSVEILSFGSKFMAMKYCTEHIRGLRFKLRMMGVKINGPAFVYEDNQSVLANTTGPDLLLKKKSNSITFHFVRKGTARDEWRTAYIKTNKYTSDMLTKPLPSGEKRRKFGGRLLNHLYVVSAA